ncbi:MAG: ribosomal protein S18 acetylase RimI-like enzyme [Marinoscillum sp.]
MEISKLGHSEKAPMELLLEADPSFEMVEKYLFSGDCYLAKEGDEVIGTIILTPNTANEIEVRNICVAEKYRRQGIGKDLLKYAFRISKMEGYETIIVKTSDVSLDAISFYKKLKFEHSFIVKGHFIKYYKEPIIENGKQAADQIVMKRKL